MPTFFKECYLTLLDVCMPIITENLYDIQVLRILMPKMSEK